MRPRVPSPRPSRRARNKKAVDFIIVLARGVRIAPGAHVKNCIIMQDGQVHNDASIENCILDKQTVIKRSARLIGPAAYPIVIAKNVVI